jgi:hypothetical protein
MAANEEEMSTAKHANPRQRHGQIMTYLLSGLGKQASSAWH